MGKKSTKGKKCGQKCEKVRINSDISQLRKQVGFQKSLRDAACIMMSTLFNIRNVCNPEHPAQSPVGLEGTQ